MRLVFFYVKRNAIIDVRNLLRGEVINLTTTYVMSIPQRYEEYLTYKRNGYAAKALAEVRKELLNRIVSEERNLLEHGIFLSLIEDEQLILLSPQEYHLNDMSRLVSISRALRMKLGLEYIDIELIRRIHSREFILRSEDNKFFYHGTNWFIDILLEEDNENVTKKHIIKYMLNKSRGFPKIDVLYENKSPEFVLFNSTLDTMTNDIPSLTRDQRIQLRTQKLCISLALMNYSLGDIINARYFLMKSVLLNHPNFEGELVMKFLNSVLLMDTQE